MRLTKLFSSAAYAPMIAVTSECWCRIGTRGSFDSLKKLFRVPEPAESGLTSSKFLRMETFGVMGLYDRAGLNVLKELSSSNCFRYALISSNSMLIFFFWKNETFGACSLRLK